jgi:hypothetical protein
MIDSHADSCIDERQQRTKGRRAATPRGGGDVSELVDGDVPSANRGVSEHDEVERGQISREGEKRLGRCGQLQAAHLLQLRKVRMPEREEARMPWSRLGRRHRREHRV